MFLREERDLLTEEKTENDLIGKKISHKLEAFASGSELDKFRQFLEEIEQITKLTVSLTIRLSRLTKRIESGSFSKEELVSKMKIDIFTKRIMKNATFLKKRLHFCDKKVENVVSTVAIWLFLATINRRLQYLKCCKQV